MVSGITFTLISYVGTAIAFVFSTLSLACGLYYLAELVEEYTVLTKKIIKGLTLASFRLLLLFQKAVVVLHLSLWLLDGLPFTNIMFSLVCHAVYSLNLANFPYINLVSVPFLASCVLVLADHFLWYQYFARHYYSFAGIASFFGICVWMVPFAFFISLSANDNALPSFDKTQDNSQKKNGILKGLFGAVLNKKDTLPVLVEAPKYTGFGNSLGPSTGAASSSSPYASLNPDARTDYPISRSSSSNSNHGHGFQSTQGSNYGSQQQYASSSSVYSHTGSTVGSRF